MGGAGFGKWLRGKSWRVQLVVLVPMSVLFTYWAVTASPLFWVLPIVFWPLVAYVSWKRPESTQT